MPGYTTSKAAMSTWMETLRNRARWRERRDDQTGLREHREDRAPAKEAMVISPAKAAELILKAAHRGGFAVGVRAGTVATGRADHPSHPRSLFQLNL